MQTNGDTGTALPLPVDYDTDLNRFLTNQTATGRFSTAGDLHEPVAHRLRQHHETGCVLDLGGGNGVLARYLIGLGVDAVVLDQAAYVATAPRPAVQGAAEKLPFRDASFTAVAALWMLYHVADPVAVLREARRTLVSGGTFVTCAPSRHNDPEFSTALPNWGRASTFDSEVAVELVGQVFDVVKAEYWDGPLISLADRAAVTMFLRGRGLAQDAAHAASANFTPPMTVTKRGVLIWARVH